MIQITNEFGYLAIDDGLAIKIRRWIEKNIVIAKILVGGSFSILGWLLYIAFTSNTGYITCFYILSVLLVDLFLTGIIGRCVRKSDSIGDILCSEIAYYCLWTWYYIMVGVFTAQLMIGNKYVMNELVTWYLFIFVESCLMFFSFMHMVRRLVMKFNYVERLTYSHGTYM